MFSCFTIPSIGTCPDASAISAPNISDELGFDGFDGPGVPVDVGCVGDGEPDVQPNAVAVSTTPHTRIDFMISPFAFRALVPGSWSSRAGGKVRSTHHHADLRAFL